LLHQARSPAFLARADAIHQPLLDPKGFLAQSVGLKAKLFRDFLPQAFPLTLSLAGVVVQ
jgi:hypothetical protein